MWKFLSQKMVRRTFLNAVFFVQFKREDISSTSTYPLFYLFYYLFTYKWRCKFGILGQSMYTSLSMLFFSVCSRLPNVPHSYVSENTKKVEYHEGDVIHFTCETGYISGPTIRYICTNTGWESIRRGKCTCKLNGLPAILLLPIDCIYRVTNKP